jgi:Na+/H+-dicarboxylate symporter
MGGPVTPRGRPRAFLSLGAYLVGLVLVCVVPVVAFSVWLTVVLIGPEALGHSWMRALGALGAVTLLLGLGVAMLAGRAIIRSLTGLAEAAADLGRDLEAGLGDSADFPHAEPGRLGLDTEHGAPDAARPDGNEHT